MTLCLSIHVSPIGSNDTFTVSLGEFAEDSYKNSSFCSLISFLSVRLHVTSREPLKTVS